MSNAGGGSKSSSNVVSSSELEKMPLEIGLTLGGSMGQMFKAMEKREDSEPCATVPEEVKILMMKIVAEAKEASKRKKRLLDIDEEDDIEKEMETMTDNSQRKEKDVMRAFTKGNGVGGGGVQITLNQMMKKDY
ncbi:hypothetical protein SESBI_48574, partial [Sesbania bispinosa]